MRCQFEMRCGPSCHRCTQCWQEIVTNTLPIHAICRGHRGAGYFLSRYLSWFGLRGSENCKCRVRARLMDQRGPDWCEENITEVLDWLREAAEEKGLPFVATAARILVARAIDAARREQAHGQKAQAETGAADVGRAQ